MVWSIFGFWTFNESANLPTFRNFGNTKTSDICVIFAKNHEWPRNWGAGPKLGPVPLPPGPGLKPPLSTMKQLTCCAAALTSLISCNGYYVYYGILIHSKRKEIRSIYLFWEFIVQCLQATSTLSQEWNQSRLVENRHMLVVKWIFDELYYIVIIIIIYYYFLTLLVMFLS